MDNAWDDEWMREDTPEEIAQQVRDQKAEQNFTLNEDWARQQLGQGLTNTGIKS